MIPSSAPRIAPGDADPQARPVRVAVVEDSAEMQAALGALFDAIGGVEVIAQFITEMDATSYLMEARPAWEIAVIDLVLYDGTGFNLIRRAKAQNPRGTVVILSSFVTQAITEKCLNLGADAVFAKNQGTPFADYLLEAAQRHRDMA